MIHHKGDGWWGIRKPDIQFRMPGFRFRSSRERIYAFPTRDIERPRRRDFAKLNLHLGIFEHPLEGILFEQPLSSLIVTIGRNDED